MRTVKFFFLFAFLCFLAAAASVEDASSEDSDSDVSEEDEQDRSAEGSTFSQVNINLKEISNKDLYAILRKNDYIAQAALSSEDLVIPHNEYFARIPLIYLRAGDLDTFQNFMGKFDYGQVQLCNVWEIVLECTQSHADYLEIVLVTQHHLIIGNFRTFWYQLMAIDARTRLDESGEEVLDRSNCKNIHPAVQFSFLHFAKLSDPLDESEKALKKYCSFCIFDLLFDEPNHPFPKSFVKSVLRIPGIDFNASRDGNCVALYTLSRHRLPDYYYRYILSDSRLDVNCIVPSTKRKHGHISCQVPALPLFWHSLIHYNMRGMKILWANEKLHVSPLVYPFFQLLRLAFLFFFFRYWDGKNFTGERKIA